MNKILGILGIVCIYFAVSLFVSVTTENETKYTVFVNEIFAAINYDTQDSNQWYNANVPEAVVTSTNPPIPPLPPIPPVRHSH